MSTLIYIDTNIYLDFLLKDRSPRQAEDAFNLFNRAIRCEFEILISKKVKTELYPNIQGNEGAMLFNFLEAKFKHIEPTLEDEGEAKRLDSVDTADALHAILAKKHGAAYLVTQNIRHFNKFKGIITPVRPSEI